MLMALPLFSPHSTLKGPRVVMASEVISPQAFFFFLNKFIYLFIFGCIGSSLLHAGFL